jgi:hypothetical protein
LKIPPRPIAERLCPGDNCGIVLARVFEERDDGSLLVEHRCVGFGEDGLQEAYEARPRQMSEVPAGSSCP